MYWNLCILFFNFTVADYSIQSNGTNAHPHLQMVFFFCSKMIHQLVHFLVQIASQISLHLKILRTINIEAAMGLYPTDRSQSVFVNCLHFEQNWGNSFSFLCQNYSFEACTILYIQQMWQKELKQGGFQRLPSGWFYFLLSLNVWNILILFQQLFRITLIVRATLLLL